jgi:hypothetical protein
MYKYKLTDIKSRRNQDSILEYILNEAEKVPALEKRVAELEVILDRYIMEKRAKEREACPDGYKELLEDING